MFIFANFVQKLTLSDQSLRRCVWNPLNFIYLGCLYYGYWRKVVSKFQKFCWANIFTIAMFIFANFVQKNNFGLSHFQKVGITLPEFYLFVLLPLLRISKGSCVKAPNVPICKYFCLSNVHFGCFCTKN